MRKAVAAAVGFGIEAVERGDGTTPAIPPPLLVQARLAARSGVGLETVLRRYAAGYSLLSQFVAAEAEAMGLAIADLLEVQTALFDRVVVAVTEEYGREEARPSSVQQQRLELVRTLLAGGFVDMTAFAYDFDAHHVALVARGDGAKDVADDVSRLLDCRLLTVVPDADTVWCWLGRGGSPLLERLDGGVLSPSHGVSIAAGEIGHGITGWRRTHRQAEAAFLLAARQPGTLVRYRDVALLASAAQDELLATSLRELYIDPLRNGRDGNDALVETLRAYFAAGRNSASAAAALSLSRQTVNYRLRVAEERVGRPLAICATAVEAALELDQLQMLMPTASANVKT